MTKNDEDGGHIAHDLLRGARAIAGELGLTPRQVFYAHERRLLPTFKIGTAICARRSTLRQHFEALERDAVPKRASQEGANG